MEERMERLRIFLEPKEYEALRLLSDREVRPVVDQLRVIVRDRLREEGLLEEHASEGLT